MCHAHNPMSVGVLGTFCSPKLVQLEAMLQVRMQHVLFSPFVPGGCHVLMFFQDATHLWASLLGHRRSGAGDRAGDALAVGGSCPIHWAACKYAASRKRSFRCMGFLAVS